MWGKRARAASVVVGLLTLAASGALGAQQLRRERRRRVSIEHEQQKARRPLYLHAPRYVIASSAAAAGFLLPAIVISAVLHVALVTLMGYDRTVAAGADETVVVSHLTFDAARRKPQAAGRSKAHTQKSPAVRPIAVQLAQPHVVLQVPLRRIVDVPRPATTSVPPSRPHPSQELPHPSNETPTAAVAAQPFLATHAAAPTSPDLTTAIAAPPACAQPFVEARAITKIVPRRPAIAEQQAASGTSQIEVEIDERGQVLRTSIYASSQNAALDAAALDAAIHSTYAPRMVNCRPSGGRYVYIVDFPA